MQTLLRDYYAGVVNPLTIATASVDLLPIAKMQPDDAETVTELKQNLNEIRATISKLVAKMSELGIPTERPAQEPAPASKKGDKA
jgi:predicted transcriptional regulator